MRDQEQNYQELEYLRDELNQRLSFSYEHSHKLFGQIMLVWGGTLVLFSTQKENFIGSVPMLFIMATIVFISVVVLYLLSQRNFESVRQITKIAAYITIFYEKKPNNEKDGKNCWELAAFEMSKNEMTKSKCERWRIKFRNEYFWLSFIATVIIIAISIVVVNRIEHFVFFNESSIGLKNKDIFGLCIILGCLFYIVISAFLSYGIFKRKSLDFGEWRNTTKDYLISFLNYAIKTKGYTVEDIIDRFGKDFYKEMKDKLKIKSSIS